MSKKVFLRLVSTSSPSKISRRSWKPFVRSVPSLWSRIQHFGTSRVLTCWKNFSLDDELTNEVKQSIEKKWQSRVYGVDCPAERNKQINKPGKHSVKYILPMFPYPSGRLHLGHVRVYTLSDVLARYHRLQGHTVIHPMGWDAYGLPAENAARDHGVEAEQWTRENISHMKSQIMEMGCCFDWEREFATCDPTYFKWTQWLFLKLWENDLVYKKRAYVYWDPVDETVLAEEQVDSDMRSWRSGAKVEKKLLQQWFIKTAVFAESLSKGLSSGDLKQGWRDVVALQDHWIGEIKGYFTDYIIDIQQFLPKTNSKSLSTEEPIRIWFPNVEALRNAKYFVLRSDHFLVEDLNASKETYPNGLKLMKFSIQNPVTGAPLPVISGSAENLPWIPASCDCRTDVNLSLEEYPDAINEDILTDISSRLDSLKISPACSTKSQWDKKDFQYYPASLRLRDWLVSRQRKWGTPIPAVNCVNCGKSSVVKSQELPISSLSTTSSTNTCTHCGSSDILLETDTLDTFFDSSWYFLRFLDSKNEKEIFDKSTLDALPVYTYVGGKEHATLHLYYARFMTQFLEKKLGLSPVTEPFQKLIPIGMVLGEAYIVKGSGQYLSNSECDKAADGKKITHAKTGQPVYTKWEKMSKSKFNGIDPSNVLQEYGIDTTRLLTMAEAAPTSTRKWPPNNPEAFLNWQRKLWLLLRHFVDAKDFGDIVFVDDEVWQKSEAEIFDTRNFYLKGINHDYSTTSQISVVISKLQAMLGFLKKVPKMYMKDSIEFERTFGAGIICLYPIMPAYSAQLWQSFRGVATFSEPEFNLDHEVWEQQWPTVDWRYPLDLICKVNGEEFVAKVERNYLDSMDQQLAEQIALDLPDVQKHLPSGEYEVIKFQVEPGFRATIALREKKIPNPNTPSSEQKSTEMVTNQTRKQI